VTAELLSVYLRHRPRHSFAWYLFGDSQRILGLNEEAERALNRAMELAPEKRAWKVHANFARLYESLGRRSDAESHFAIAAADAEGGQIGWVWILRGSNLALQGMLREAEACHRTAILSADVDLDEAHFNLGLVLRAQGRYTEARKAFESALGITPDYIEAHDALCSVDGIENAMELLAKLPAPAEESG
jgi:tetratricopeptide (TPR) repeat protein